MKSIISRYILRNHFAPFVFGSFTVLFLFLFQFLLKYIDDLVGKGLSEWVITQLIVLNIAWMVVLALPMGVLFSTLFSFGGMSAAHEVTIVKASGGSLVRMMLPVFISGIIVSILLFWFNDRVLPEANHRAKTLMDDIRRKKPTFSIESGQFSSQIEGYTILARHVDSLSGALKGVTIYDNTNSQRQNIVSADSGMVSFSPDYSKLILNLTDGEIHQLVPGNVNNYRIVDFKKYRILMNATGFTFEQTDEKGMSRGDREMSIADMTKIVNQARAESRESDSRIQDRFKEHFDFIMGRRPAGNNMTAATDMNAIPQQPQVAMPKGSPAMTDSEMKKLFPNRRPMLNDKVAQKQIESSTSNMELYNLREVQKRISFMRVSLSTDLFRKMDADERARQYEVEIQKKYAIPFACIVFVLVGCPLGIMTKGGNFGLSAAISLGFYIIYWACLIGGEKLADRGLMSPVLSMWMGNILVGVMGIFLTLKVNNESITFPGAELIRKLFSREKSS